ncbi:hypothetical protein [Rhizobium sp. NFACC06-2]|uniref:hypothetical protein n=1 Tax=Rhizobium sp. NFACC06-2 TaxID=1566264 RepID=UPI000876389A|nr:hypothetical protein [Rhizobium sp. NFACC06-2]SCY90431.1 hypothetical protein SAMN03159288_05102 [Rhizobium sp. NFACC06-2]
MEKSVFRLGKRKRSSDGLEQSQLEPRRSVRLAGKPAEFKGLEIDRRKTKSLSADAGDIIDFAVSGSAGGLAPRLRKNENGPGIHKLAAETVELIATYSAIGDLYDGSHDLAKYRLLSRRFSELFDNKSLYFAKVEGALHAVSLTKTFIESAHVKRRLDDENGFFEYEASDGKGNPATWSKKYLADHVNDIYAVMKFIGREYNASLLSAALDAPDGMEKARMLHQFALNAVHLDTPQLKSVADASVNILNGGGSGAFFSAKAFALFKRHAQRSTDLAGGIKTYENKLTSRQNSELDLHRLLSKAEEELDRFPDALNNIARAASDLSHKYDWCRFNASVAERHQGGPHSERLMVRELALTPLPVTISDVALKIGARFEEAMSFREAEAFLTGKTKEKSSANERRAELADRPQRGVRGD